jgi:hypothetical protein
MSTDSTIALVTLADARLYSGKTVGAETEDDSIIETLIDGISAGFNSYVGRRIIEQTETIAYLDGNGKETILLPRYPNVTITSLTEDDVALTEGEDEDYRIYSDEGMIVRLEGRWAKGRKNIILTSYKAGYALASLPKDLKMVALEQVSFEYGNFRNKMLGVSSRSASDGSVTRFETGQFLKSVQAVLDRYRDFRV